MFIQTIKAEPIQMSQKLNTSTKRMAFWNWTW